MTNEVKDYILAIDPGLTKCGLAILDKSGAIVARSNISIADAGRGIVDLLKTYKPVMLAIGDGTGSDSMVSIIQKLSRIKVAVVGEKNTTLEARELAWRDNPPKGLWRLLPKLFWPTPAELDSWAAVVIGRRALEGHLKP